MSKYKEQESKLVPIGIMLGKNACFHEEGQFIFGDIDSILKNGEKCVVCFHGVEKITHVFLNSAIGQLYGKYSNEYLLKNLQIEDLSCSDQAVLKQVIDNAKKYFSFKQTETTTQRFKIKPEQSRPDEINIEVTMDHDFDKPENNIIESALKDIIGGLRGLNISLGTILLNGTDTEVPTHLWQAHAHIQKAILHLKSAHMKHTGRREF